MLKKISLLFSLAILTIMCSLGASAGFAFVDEKPYVEDAKTKIIDHVVYKLIEPQKGEKYYMVYDWFDTEKASETVKEINIVPEIDGIKVTKIQNIKPLDGPEYWKNKNYSVKKVTIPDTITDIGSYFFSALDGVEELTVPASVKAFPNDGITDEGVMTTFDEMESLKKITFLGDVDTLGGFANCKKLEAVVLKGKVKDVATDAFYGCTSLKSFDFSKIEGSVGNNAFGNTGFTSVTVPVKFLESFGGCKKLTKIVATGNKNDALFLDYGAFYGCTALKTITFPKETSSINIGSDAFYNCKNLQKIVFPESCTGKIKIEKNAFRNCTSLKSVKFPATCGKLTIGDDAFRNCTSLKTVTLPKTTTGVTIGYRAFRNCQKLSKVYYATNIEKIYGGAFRGCVSLTSLTLNKIKMIGKNAFYGCKKLKTITVTGKSSAPKIYKNAFYNTAKGIKFTAKNEAAAKKWKTALSSSGLKNMKVVYPKYISV
ncbi:MAG: leucine-rich repeat domain-containing protein [Clostridia bacterium]|nr:leucine-rich repeat domain-containing protein [Clostridia bacterium]